MEEPPFVGDWVRKMRLGCGGFGIVTLWHNEKTSDSLAIKMCRRDISQRITPKQCERWTKEVQIMKNINHPNIVHTRRIPQILFEALKEYNTSDLPILSMEYCSKGSLRQVLNQSHNCSGLSESEVRFILEDISSAVAYLHNMKITHRDLKPDNIVLQILDPKLSEIAQFKNRANKIIYKLIDLGYAKELDEKSISESFVGTLQYLAPEILLNKSYSNSVDYWSFGLVAFEIICGIRPFLPNMAPAQWLHQIQKKGHDTIRIYQDMDDTKTIKYSDKIYEENLISNTLQVKLEKWLILALDYDSRQRGYDKPKNNSASNAAILEKKTVTFNDIEVQKESLNKDLKFFTLLTAILNTKIISVFVVYTYQFLSYEIDEDMKLSILLERIQLDTNNQVLVNDMIFILPNREHTKIDIDGYASQLWFDSHDTPMVHIWKRGSIISDKHINLNSTPEVIKKMCKFPKIKISGHAMKKFASDCLFYVKKEINAYDTLIISCNSKIKLIQDQILNMTEMFHNMKTEWIFLSRNVNIAENALHYDCEKSEAIHGTKAIYHNKWIRSLENISNKISTLNDAVEHITKRYDSIKRRHNEIEFEKMFKTARSITDVENIFVQIKQNYEIIRRILKGDFNYEDNPDNCKNLKKLVVSFINVREKKMLKDPDLKKNIQYIIDMEVEIAKTISTMHSAIENISKLSKELNLINFERQENIWGLIGLESSKQEKIYTQSNYVDRKAEFAIYATPKNTASNKIAQNQDDHILQSLTNSISGNFDCKSMIDDNMSLRFMHQDLIQECLDMYKSILNDQMDFDFLHTEDL